MSVHVYAYLNIINSYFKAKLRIMKSYSKATKKIKTSDQK